MDDDPTARVDRARAVFRKAHIADRGSTMAVHEFGTYAIAAGFDATMTDLVRARMALDPDSTQSCDPEAFFTWLCVVCVLSAALTHKHHLCHVREMALAFSPRPRALLICVASWKGVTLRSQARRCWTFI
jgi:hypothetical protein